MRRPRHFIIFALSLLLLVLSAAPALATGERTAETPLITAQPIGRTIRLYGDGFKLSITAEVSDGGTLSYQWYHSADRDPAGMTAVSSETDPLYGCTAELIPTLTVGEHYYCCRVTNTLTVDGESFTAEVCSDTVSAPVFDNLLTAIEIRGIEKPVTGAVPDTTAQGNVNGSFQGYDIDNVSWTPEDDIFLPGVAYTVSVRVELWQSAFLRSDFICTVDGQPAVPTETADNGFLSISYTFPATAKNSGDTTDSHAQQTAGKPTQSGGSTQAPAAAPQMPTITAQPHSIRCMVGEREQLSVTATSAIDSEKLRYIWYFSTDGAEKSWQEVDCDNTAVLELDTSAPLSGFYYVKVVDESTPNLSLSVDSTKVYVEVSELIHEKKGPSLPLLLICGAVLVLIGGTAGFLIARHKYH